MRSVRSIALILAAVGSSAAPASAGAAARYDGSVPFTCVPIVVFECVEDDADAADAECKRRAAASVNLPQFLNVDVKALKVYAEPEGRQSPVRNVEHLNGNLIVQGGQDGRGWTMTVSEETGKMSATVSSGSEGFVVFGACTMTQAGR